MNLGPSPAARRNLHPAIRWRTLTAAAAAAVTLGGCVTAPAGPAEVFAPQGVRAAGFQGVIADAPPAKARYIFITHGMGETEETFADPLLNWLVDAGYNRFDQQRGDGRGWIAVKLVKPYAVSGGALPCPPGGDQAPPCRFASFGQYKIDSFRNSAGDVVHVYRYFWQDSLQAVQTPFIANDEKVENRASINGPLKHGIVNYGFADAAGYLGPMGALMREGAEGAICSMMRDASVGGPTRDRPTTACVFSGLDPDAIPGDVSLNFMSMSLGSRLLIDTLVSAYEPSEPAVSQALAATAAARTARVRTAILRQAHAFYMLANQLPLLGIGCVEVRRDGDPAPRANCRNPSFEAAVTAARAPDLPPLQVVSFQDPDDLLGFRFSDDFAKPASSRLKVVQVVHRNTPQLGIFSYTFANPLAAHATELEHLSSARLILCGGALQADGKTLEPAAACLPKPSGRPAIDWR